jgi:hypothetical protein
MGRGGKMAGCAPALRIQVRGEKHVRFWRWGRSSPFRGTLRRP